MDPVEGFATGITCFDGRIQDEVLAELRRRFGAAHIDHITRPGAVQFLAEPITATGEAILNEVAFSIDRHSSTQIGVVAHHECAGNPRSDSDQVTQLVAASRLLVERFPSALVLALFFDPRTGFETIVDGA